MNSPDVSVLVPIYNVSRYLEQCLNSLQAQTLPSMEFILIDDGSTDGSGEIAEKFAAAHSRFRLFHQTNQGIAKVQNKAISLARGKYIGFVDGDDWAEPDMFQTLFQLAESEDADIAGGSFYDYFQDDNISVPSSNRHFVSLLQAHGGHMLGGAEAALFDNAVTWSRIYRRTLVEANQLGFAENQQTAEDVPFFWDSYVAARKIVLTDRPLYHYRNQRPGQLTSISDRRVFSFLTLFDNFESFLRRKQISSLEPWILHMKLSRYCFGYEKLAPELRSEYFQLVRQTLTDSGVTAHSRIARGPFSGKYLILSILHPLTLRCILHGNEAGLARIVAFRQFLTACPRKIRALLP